MTDDPPTPSPAPPLTASERAALHVREQLQLSGERDRLKERLQRQLTDHGWHAAMHARADEIARNRAEKAQPPLTAREMANELTQAGRDSIPGPVRAALMNDLLRAARDFATKSSGSSVPSRPS